MGRGMVVTRLVEPIDITVPTVNPVMHINHAIYGHHTNTRKMSDVTSEMKNLVEEQGRNKFTINKEDSLHALFNVDPCRGLRKRLRIGYVSRGLSGAMRIPVAVIDGHSKLHTDIFIGYPKAPMEKKTSAG